MAQGDIKTGTKGTNSIFVMSHSENTNILRGRAVTYCRLVMNFCPQKEDPNQVRMTAGGNLLRCPGELTTRTTNLTTAKLVWNSVLSTEGARFMRIDIKNFYLGTLLDRFEYMKIPISTLPKYTMEQYNMHKNAKNGYVYFEIRKAIYGLQQAGILSSKQLRKFLKPAGYYKVAHTPGLWRHTTQPIQLTLVIDDFGVKYVGQEHAEHIIKTLQNTTRSQLIGMGIYTVG
jgi:hypothetical protein